MHADDRALGDGRVTGERRLERAGRQPVARDVEHVVGAAHDEHVSVVVDVPAVAGEVVAVVRRQVRRDKPRVVAPQRRQRAGRHRQLQAQRTLDARAHLLTALVEHPDVVAGHGHARRTGLGGQWFQPPRARADGPAGLGLPPVVDHRDTELVPSPRVGVGVEALAGEEQRAQRRRVVAGQQRGVRVLLADGAHGRRRGEHPRHPVVGDDAPERPGVGGADRLALVEHRGAAREQRRVDDVGVADHPADVARGEPHVAGPGTEDVPHRPVQRDGVTAVVADDALRAARGAAGVEDVQRVGPLDGDALGVGHDPDAHHRGPVVVAVAHLGNRLRSLQHQTGLRLVRAASQCRVEQRLVLDHPRGLEAAGRRHHDDRLRVVDAGRELGRGEAAEHHRVHGPDAGAGQHRDDRLGHHRHVDDDAVALVDAERAQHPGAPADEVEQMRVGVGAHRAGDARVVDQRGLVGTAGDHMAVEGVVASVHRAAGKPAVEGRGRPVEHARGLGEPRDALGGLAPEALRVIEAAAVGCGPRPVGRGGAARAHAGILPAAGGTTP